MIEPPKIIKVIPKIINIITAKSLKKSFFHNVVIFIIVPYNSIIPKAIKRRNITPLTPLEKLSFILFCSKLNSLISFNVLLIFLF